MQASLFLDTGCFVARELTRDQFHSVASVGWRTIVTESPQLYCSEHVLDEVMTLLARRHSYAFAQECGHNYLSSKLITWLETDKEDLVQALNIMKKLSDHGVSFTDCISMVLMKKARVSRVFGFDRHFTYARFRLWPVPE